MIRAIVFLAGIMSAVALLPARSQAATGPTIPAYLKASIRKAIREDARKQAFYSTLHRPSVRSQITVVSPTEVKVTSQIYTRGAGWRPGLVQGAHATFIVKLTNWGNRVERQGNWSRIAY